MYSRSSSLRARGGWKGKTVGDAAVHEKQALVLTNTGNATGLEILELAELITQDIYKKYQIALEKEVIIL